MPRSVLQGSTNGSIASFDTKLTNMANLVYNLLVVRGQLCINMHKFDILIFHITVVQLFYMRLAHNMPVGAEHYDAQMRHNVREWMHRRASG